MQAPTCIGRWTAGVSRLMSTREVDALRQLATEAGLAGASIVVQPMHPGGPRVAVDADRRIYPASMIKLPIAVALDLACTAGTAALGDTVAVSAANMTTSDAPSPFEPGYVARLGELGWAMLAKSDNVATNVLIDVLGRASVDAACAELGLLDTHVGRKLSGSLPLIDDPEQDGINRHPAADAARILARLAAADPDGWIVRAMHAQVWNDKLAAGFRPGDTFAHKTGDTDEVSHDGGILVLPGGRSYVVVVYTELPSQPATDACFVRFARALRASFDDVPRRGASTAP